MRRVAVGALLALLLAGCFARDEKYDYRVTAAGYQLAWENVGAVPARYTLEAIGARFDVAVEHAVAHLAKYGVPAEQVRSQARAYKHIGYDAARFAISASPTGWAAGAWSGDYRIIQLAFWARAKGNVVPADAPPWTVYTWGALRPDPKYDWGYEPPPFPALGHELGHAIYGPQFEHGWTPPVVTASGFLRDATPEERHAGHEFCAFGP